MVMKSHLVALEVNFQHLIFNIQSKEGLHMHTNKRGKQRLVGVIIAVVAFAFATLLAPVAQADTGNARFLKGTWIGSYTGFNDSGYVSGDEKIVITKTRGSNAVGTWQSRSKGTKKWGSPKKVRLSVFGNEGDTNGIENISGADSEGQYVGIFEGTDNRLTFGYTARDKGLLVLTLSLTKK
tara:strand:+ start:49 stop:591 length:543 start_codon:yes stop_codon:yes gene_type:complete